MRITVLEITVLASDRAPDGRLMAPKKAERQVWEADIPPEVDAWLRKLLKMEEANG